jgi:hypothetical protein
MDMGASDEPDRISPDGNDDAVLFIATGQPAWTALQDAGNDGSGGRYL